MSKKEEQLYPDIEKWLKKYLEDKYSKKYKVTTTFDTSRIFLDSYLKNIRFSRSKVMDLLNQKE